MGLLDRILKSNASKSANSTVSGAVEGAVSGAAGGVFGRLGKNYQAGVNDRAGFKNLLTEQFPDLALREDVPVTELSGEGKAYDLGLYRGDNLVGLVMLTQKNRDNNRAFKGARQAALNAGIPFINFYLHMQNEIGYVSERIRSQIK
ncbi:MAG: hypothetical protein FWG47_04010 [Propionibacteriaceae bacterium]|nr:hypothetical protein [Propionibacteriaceae bacterium]